MNNSARSKKFTYLIMDEQGKESMVSFNHAHQCQTWINNSKVSDNKYYTIVKEIK